MVIDFSALKGSLGTAARLPLAMVPDGLSVPILQGPMRGMRWITGSSTHGCWLGSYELDKQKLIFDATGREDVFFDIGANVGFYTLLASRKMKAVWSFEPLPGNIRRLREHLALNRLDTECVMTTAV